MPPGGWRGAESGRFSITARLSPAGHAVSRGSVRPEHAGADRSRPAPKDPGRAGAQKKCESAPGSGADGLYLLTDVTIPGSPTDDPRTETGHVPLVLAEKPSPVRRQPARPRPPALGQTGRLPPPTGGARRPI